MPKIYFTQTNRVYHVSYPADFFQLYQLFLGDIPLKFGCCKGDCGTCKIKIKQGENNLSPKTKKEEIFLQKSPSKEHRLACQCSFHGDVVIEN